MPQLFPGILSVIESKSLQELLERAVNVISCVRGVSGRLKATKYGTVVLA